MAEATSSSASTQAPQELRLTRILGAPRALVFKLWTDPQPRGPLVGPTRVHEPRLRI